MRPKQPMHAVNAIRPVSVVLTLGLLSACGSPAQPVPAPRTVRAEATTAPSASDPPAGPASARATGPTGPLAESPLSELAREMCEVALAGIHKHPLPANRLQLERVELHDRGHPEVAADECRAVSFSVRSELVDAPKNDARMAQTIFVLTRRRLTAHAHAVGSSPDVHVTPNTAKLPEITQIHDAFVSAVIGDQAGTFQASTAECDDIGIQQQPRCAREMATPVASKELADGWRDPLAKHKALELDTVYVIAPARSGLIRMAMSFYPPVLRLETEHRQPDGSSDP